MPSQSEKVRAELSYSTLAWSEAMDAHAAFIKAVQRQEWGEAEGHFQCVTAWMEGSMDAFRRSAQLVQGFERGG